jgi:glycerophosphoryl diester phosphodiesterase
VDKRWPSHLPLVFSSFNWLSLAIARQRLPQVPRGLLVGGIPRDWQARIAEFGCRNIHCDGAVLTPAQSAELRAANVGIFCYTVNDVDQARALLDAGADGVFTDYPKRLTDLLGT